MSEDQPKCEECGGATVQFRGRGLDVEYKVCSRWQEPGHLSEQEAKKLIADRTRAHMPRSGRFA